MLVNHENYFMYDQFVRNRSEKMIINVDDICIDNFNEYFEGCMNLLRDAPNEDGDDTDFDYVTQTPIYINFRDRIEVPLRVPDLLFNLAGWYACIRTNQLIQPRHIIFDPRYLTRNTIKRFMDNNIILQTRKTFSTKDISAILDDTSVLFKAADEFSLFLMDTVNLEDSLDLMNIDKEFYDILHADLSDVPIEEFNKAGMDLTNKAVDIILKSGDVMPYEHCFATAFRSKEGINIKQNKEGFVSIGTKPDGNGGVFAVPINASFINGGVADPLYYFIDSSNGRTAQIMSKINVGDSGAFARLLGLNNTDTYLHPDPHYDCNCKNFQKITISNIEFLNRYLGRYYRMYPDGMEYVISGNDTWLIGKTILLRSPMTCASNARGEGICYKCYGDIAYTNRNINIGKMAAEILSSRLTQRLLSSKHLLTTVIKKIKWTPDFYKFFEVEGNSIKLQDDIDLKNYTIIIDPDDIDMENELDVSDYEDKNSNSSEVYNEYVTKFSIVSKSGEVMEIHTEDFDKMYLSADFNNIIRKKAINDDDKFAIPMNVISTDNYIFYIVIHNNELSKTMEELMDIINKNAVTKSMDKDQLLQTFIDTTIKGDLYIASSHCEVILSNQLRDIDNPLEKPKWQYPNAEYQIFTLNDALNFNPSIIITLMYQRLSKVLYNPLSFKKNGTSFIDLFFMENPTEHLAKTTDVVEGTPDDEKLGVLTSPFIRVDNSTASDDDWKDE